MSKLLFTVCAFGLLLSSASAQDWTKEEMAAGVQKLEYTRHVPSGKTQTLWFAALLNSDCSSEDVVEVKKIQEPAHGSVEIMPTEGHTSYSKDSARYKCNDRKVHGVNINYKSADRYQGSDEFNVLIMYPNGLARQIGFNINVWQPSPVASVGNKSYLIECGAIKNTSLLLQRDNDLVYKIVMRLTTGGKSAFDLVPVHITVHGKRYNRLEQYSDFRTVPNNNGIQWTGSKGNKIMRGYFYWDNSTKPMICTEELFENNKLSNTTSSFCHIEPSEADATPARARENLYAAISNWECGHLFVTLWRTFDKEAPTLYRVSIAEALVPYFGAVTWDEQANKVVMNGKPCQEWSGVANSR